jgi:hypothetical protein
MSHLLFFGLKSTQTMFTAQQSLFSLKQLGCSPLALVDFKEFTELLILELDYLES